MAVRITASASAGLTLGRREQPRAPSPDARQTVVQIVASRSPMHCPKNVGIDRATPRPARHAGVTIQHAIQNLESQISNLKQMQISKAKTKTKAFQMASTHQRLRVSVSPRPSLLRVPSPGNRALKEPFILPDRLQVLEQHPAPLGDALANRAAVVPVGPGGPPGPRTPPASAPRGAPGPSCGRTRGRSSPARSRPRGSPWAGSGKRPES